MLPSQYARIINRALANPNSGIKRPTISAALPTDAALYYTTAEAADLTRRPRTTLITILHKLGVRFVTGDYVGNIKSPTANYWLKEDVDANLHALKPTYTARTQTPTPNLATHTTRGKARSFLAVHPGRAFYSAKEAAAILSVSQATLVRLAKKHNLTKFKRHIFTPNTNQTHIQSFFLKKEIHSLAKHRRNEK